MIHSNWWIDVVLTGNGKQEKPLEHCLLFAAKRRTIWKMRSITGVFFSIEARDSTPICLAFRHHIQCITYRKKASDSPILKASSYTNLCWPSSENNADKMNANEDFVDSTFNTMLNNNNWINFQPKTAGMYRVRSTINIQSGEIWYIFIGC